jgi:uncharacterized membrane protein
VLALLALSAKGIAAAVVLGVLLLIGAVVQGFVLVRAYKASYYATGHRKNPKRSRHRWRG